MTDFSKAFDCNDHQLLIAKMHEHGFDIPSLKSLAANWQKENRG